jgi:hypothetical protein
MLQGRIHTGDESAEFYKALVSAGEGATPSGSASERQESQQAARSSGRPSITPATRRGPGRDRKAPAGSGLDDENEESNLAASKGLGYAVSSDAGHDTCPSVRTCLADPWPGRDTAVCALMQMLAKAGWRGGGLGAEEQGITSPLPAWHNAGRRGIGAAPKSQPASKAGVCSTHSILPVALPHDLSGWS